MTIATILPVAKTIFLDTNNNPLSGGSVFMYVPPNTTTLKTSWKDATGTIPNDNPVILDGDGGAYLYGAGQYLQEVWDADNNLIFTGLTQDVYGLVMSSANTFTSTNDFTGGSILVPTRSPGDNSTHAASTAYVDSAVAALPTSEVPWALIAGLIPTSVTGSNTTATITFSQGQASEILGNHLFSIAAKVWSVSNGTAINGYEGGSTLPNSSTIHFYGVFGSTGVGIWASLSATAPSPPAGYNTYFRRIFSLTTDNTGTLLPGTAIETEGGGLLYWYTTQILDIGATVPSASRTLFPLTVPNGIKVEPFYRANTNTNQVSILLTSGDETDVAATQTVGNMLFTTTPGYDISSANGIGVNNSTGRDGTLTTNTSGQIGARAFSGSALNGLWLVTRGFKDFRRT